MPAENHKNDIYTMLAISIIDVFCVKMILYQKFKTINYFFHEFFTPNTQVLHFFTEFMQRVF